MVRIILAVAALLVPSMAAAAEVTMFVPGAVQSIVREMMKDYESRSGNTVKYVFDTAGGVAKRVAGGERGDVVISTAGALANLANSGLVVQDSIRVLGAMGVGVAVRAGAARPDIGDVAAFKASMLAAKSIMYADPAKGGQSGIHVAKVMAQLGIDKDIAPKLQLRDRGPDGLKEVAAGTIEIGLGQISEILANTDVVLVGPFPAQIQDLVTFSASVRSTAQNASAAREIVELLLSPAAKERFKRAGFQ